MEKGEITASGFRYYDYVIEAEKCHPLQILEDLRYFDNAIIEIKEGHSCTEEEMNDFCLKLPRYKRPKKVIFADIPRNATGKIEKPALRKRYGADKLVAQENMG